MKFPVFRWQAFLMDHLLTIDRCSAAPLLDIACRGCKI